MYATFKARAEAVSAEVHRFAERDCALAFVADFLKKEGVSDAPGGGAVWADAGFLGEADRRALSTGVPGLSFTVTKDAAATARVGVTQTDWAVANTGTLAHAADAVESRLASTLPPIHVAIAPSDRIVPDLAALLRNLGPAQSRYVALVTGPSRTADIERVLTIGVHGPGRLVIVFVDDFQPGTRS
jgi:L-lactate dehydrogenase complex protein LldG